METVPEECSRCPGMAWLLTLEQSGDLYGAEETCSQLLRTPGLGTPSKAEGVVQAGNS